MENKIMRGQKTQELTLLIYIPCYSDYEMALSNIRKIRAQKNQIPSRLDQTNLKIKTIISINGEVLSNEILNSIKLEADQVLYFMEPIGADSNITNGFMTALQERPDFFWILSANEILQSGAISYLYEKIATNSETDILITNSKNREGQFKLTNVFVDLPSGLGLGFISGVIYNFNKMKFAFPAAAKFGWTGWGQLAVLQTACLKLRFLNVSEFPDSKLYEKPRTYIDSVDGEGSPISEFEVVRKNYQHSFFGMPILIASLYSRDPETRKLVISDWIKNNWYKIKYFSDGVESRHRFSEPHLDTHWLRRLSNPLVFQGSISSKILALVGCIFKIEKIRKVRLLKKLLVSARK